mgnify:CR=1 FL=1
MKMNAKIMAVAIVAMFCAAGFVSVLADEDDADKVTYHYYLQLNDDTTSKKAVSEWLTSYSASSQSKESYLEGLIEALSDSGYDYEFNDTWIVNIAGFSGHGAWDNVSDYYSFAVYYADGEDWKATSTYDEGTTFAIVFDKYLWQSDYDKLSDDEKEQYEYSSYGYASKLPTVSTTDYEGNSIIIMYTAIIVVVIVVDVVVVIVVVIVVGIVVVIVVNIVVVIVVGIVVSIVVGIVVGIVICIVVNIVVNIVVGIVVNIVVGIGHLSISIVKLQQLYIASLFVIISFD